MKKFLKLLFSVLIAGLCLTLIIIYVMDKAVFEKSETLPFQKIDKYYSSDRKFNMGILGSSRAQGNYVPSILNSRGSVQNFGLAGTGNKIWYYMLLDELQNSSSMKLIVSIDLSAKPIKNGKDFDYNYYLKLPRKTKLYEALEPATKGQMLPKPIFYFGVMKGFSAESLKDYINLTNINDNGFKGKTNTISQEQFQTLVGKQSSIKVKFDSDLWKKTFEKIKTSQDTVYFVLAPSYNKIIERINYTEFKDGMEELASNYPTVYFYDFSNSINEKNLFYDPEHLNYKGAVKFSTMLKDSIFN